MWQYTVFYVTLHCTRSFTAKQAEAIIKNTFLNLYVALGIFLPYSELNSLSESNDSKMIKKNVLLVTMLKTVNI